MYKIKTIAITLYYFYLMQHIFIQATKQYLFSARLSRYTQSNTIVLYAFSLFHGAWFPNTSQTWLIREVVNQSPLIFFNKWALVESDKKLTYQRSFWKISGSKLGLQKGGNKYVPFTVIVIKNNLSLLFYFCCYSGKWQMVYFGCLFG